MNKKVMRIISVLVWTVFLTLFTDVSRDLINSGWFMGHPWRQDALILGWFIFGGLSATLWPEYGKKNNKN